MRVHFSTWGNCSVSDGYAMRGEDETASAAVIRSVERRLREERGMEIITLRSDGWALPEGWVHYAGTVGRPCPGGGWTPHGRIWIEVRHGA